MGGTSTTQQTQASTTAPWAAAQPAINGILGQLQPQIANSGLNGTEQGAINQLTANGQAGDPYAGQIGQNATSLLNGGGAMNQAPAVQNAYNAYSAQTNPLASNTNYDPTQTPGVQAALQAIQAQVGNSVNSQFAGAGRSLSGANQMAYGTGIAQAEAPLLLGQYNQNIQNQQGAAQNLYNAGNATSGLLSGMQNQYNTNTQTGTQASSDALAAQNYGPQAVLAAQQLGQQIPAQNLGLLAQIGIPIAGLGGTSTGTASGSNTMSGAQQFGTIASGIGNLMPKVNLNISDRRAKEDIAQVGTLFDGTPVYRFRYIGQPAFQIGLMADDIEKVMPEAVGQIGQFKAVDYKLATDKALEAA